MKRIIEEFEAAIAGSKDRKEAAEKLWEVYFREKNRLRRDNNNTIILRKKLATLLTIFERYIKKTEFLPRSQAGNLYQNEIKEHGI